MPSKDSLTGKLGDHGQIDTRPEKDYLRDGCIKRGKISQYDLNCNLRPKILIKNNLYRNRNNYQLYLLKKDAYKQVKNDRYFSKKFKTKLSKEIKYNFVAKRLQAHSTSSKLLDIDYKINDTESEGFALSQFFDKLREDKVATAADSVGENTATANHAPGTTNSLEKIAQQQGWKVYGSEKSKEDSMIKFADYIPPKQTIKETNKILNECIERAHEDRTLYTKTDIENAWLELVSYQDEISIMDPKILPPEHKITKQLTILDKALETFSLEMNTDSLRLKLCQAELYEMHYLFGSETKQIKGVEAGLTSFAFYNRLVLECAEKAETQQPSAFLFAKVLLSHLSDSTFSVNSHIRYIDKRVKHLQNTQVRREQSLELLFYYALHFLRELFKCV